MKAMRKGYGWPLGFLFLFCVVAAGILLSGEIVQTFKDEIQRDIELKTHRELIQSITANGRSPSLFTTDGCSGGLSKAWRRMADRFPDFAEAHEKSPPWEPCCIAHDRAYHSAGGATEAHQSYAFRLAADQALRACVVETGNRRSANLSAKYGLSEEKIHAAYEAIANAMFDAVRIGGLPCSGLKWRWGYGYAQCAKESISRQSPHSRAGLSFGQPELTD
jgi:hypothetical protein